MTHEETIGVFQAQAGERDWPEDFRHENGNYLNRCAVCGHDFAGYKRRVVCKKCANKQIAT